MNLHESYTEPTRASRGGNLADFVQNALSVVEQAIDGTLKPAEGNMHKAVRIAT